jgi:hypothetical protein
MKQPAARSTRWTRWSICGPTPAMRWLMPAPSPPSA